MRPEAMACHWEVNCHASHNTAFHSLFPMAIRKELKLIWKLMDSSPRQMQSYIPGNHVKLPKHWYFLVIVAAVFVKSWWYCLHIKWWIFEGQKYGTYIQYVPENCIIFITSSGEICVTKDVSMTWGINYHTWHLWCKCYKHASFPFGIHWNKKVIMVSIYISTGYILGHHHSIKDLSISAAYLGINQDISSLGLELYL